jgi:RNA polymerase sigma-70 factor (ECF subfamily)
VSQDLDGHVPAIIAGDLDAFGRWMAGAEPVLRASLRPFAVHVDAEAVVQEALLRTWQVIPRFTADGRSNGLLRLALRIARNLAIDEIRRTGMERVDVETLERALEDAAERSEPALPDPLLRRVIAECRDRLPQQPARALAARLDGGGTRSDRQLAIQLGMRLNTFLQNVSRARRLLLACLEERGVSVKEELA